MNLRLTLALLVMTPSAAMAQIAERRPLTGWYVADSASDSLVTDWSQAVIPSPRSPVLAGILETAISTLGYAYAGNWSRGLPPFGGQVVGAVLIGTSYDSNSDECPTQCALGAAIWLGSKVWGVVGAVRTANERNQTLRIPSVGFAQIAGGPGVIFRWALH
jgi:hypothetical protein